MSTYFDEDQRFEKIISCHDAGLCKQYRCKPDIITLSIPLQQDKEVFVILLFRRLISKEAGIKLERRENNTRTVLDAVQNVRPLRTDCGTKLIMQVSV